MLISIIAAIGKNRELGKDNKLLWSIPEDLKRFREKTRNHPVIMGRKTFESIGHALPNRTNIIVTRNKDYTAPNCKVFDSVDLAIDFAKTVDKEEIFIIGGASVYAQAMNIADKLYLTIVDQEFDADTFFPDYSMFRKKIFEKKLESGKYHLTFLEFLRDGP